MTVLDVAGSPHPGPILIPTHGCRQEVCLSPMDGAGPRRLPLGTQILCGALVGVSVLSWLLLDGLNHTASHHLAFFPANLRFIYRYPTIPLHVFYEPNLIQLVLSVVALAGLAKLVEEVPSAWMTRRLKAQELLLLALFTATALPVVYGLIGNLFFSFTLTFFYIYGVGLHGVWSLLGAFAIRLRNVYGEAKVKVFFDQITISTKTLPAWLLGTSVLAWLIGGSGSGAILGVLLGLGSGYMFDRYLILHEDGTRGQHRLQLEAALKDLRKEHFIALGQQITQSLQRSYAWLSHQYAALNGRQQGSFEAESDTALNRSELERKRALAIQALQQQQQQHLASISVDAAGQAARPSSQLPILPHTLGPVAAAASDASAAGLREPPSLVLQMSMPPTLLANQYVPLDQKPRQSV